MIRTRAVGLAVLVAASVPCASAYGAGHHSPRSGCAGAPTSLTFTRGDGQTFGTLRWKPGRGAQRGIRYRVLRDRAIIGQTRHHSIRINIRLDHRYVVHVRLVAANRQVSRCSAKLIVFSAYRLPSAPQWPAASAASGSAVTISWQPSKRGDGRIVGYRLLRSGTTVAQRSATSMSVPISSNRGYRFTVVAVDSNRRTSAPSLPVTLQTGHSPPPPPGQLIGGALSASTVGLSWQPSVPPRGHVIGYRVFRDGVPVGQYQGTAVTFANLAASTSYNFTLEAVDGLGYLSQPASVSVRTEDPIPTTGHAYAFLLASTGQSFQDFQAHYQEIGAVSPTYYDCDAQANLTGTDVPLITGWARARQVKVMPRFNCQRTAVLDQILHSPTLSQRWLGGIVSRVVAAGDSGAVLDWEAGPAADRNAFSAFVTALAAQLHVAGKSLVICVSAKTADVPNHPRSTFFDYNVLSAQADALFVMAWGIHWATSTPGAQDDITWVRNVVAYIQTLPRVNKYVLGMQLYAMDWANGGGSANPANSYEYQDAMDLAARMGVTPQYDPTSDALTFSYTDGAGVHHNVWFTDSTTEATRISLAKSAGFGGIGLWRLGHEDQSLWQNPLIASAW